MPERHSGRHTAWKLNKEMYVLPAALLKGNMSGFSGARKQAGQWYRLYKIFVLKEMYHFAEGLIHCPLLDCAVAIRTFLRN
jgi:hypothetical protein